MKSYALPVSMLALVLTACGGGGSSSSDGPAVNVPTLLSAGVYSVSVASGDSVAAGKYYLAADGQALVVLNDGGEKAATVYSREAGSNKKWVASPAVANDTAVSFATTTAQVSAALALPDVAGNYSVLLSDQSQAVFTVDANGKIAAGSSSCKITGQLVKASIAQALAVKLATAGCAGLPASITGYALQDGDYAPAKLRIVNADSSALVDIWAFGV